MSTAIDFPQQGRLVLTEGIDAQTGLEVYLLERVSAAGRSLVSVRNTRLEIVLDVIERESDDVTVEGAAC